MAEINTNSLDRYPVAISTLWFCETVFKLGSNSQIATFWEHASIDFAAPRYQPLLPHFWKILDPGYDVPKHNLSACLHGV